MTYFTIFAFSFAVIFAVWAIRSGMSDPKKDGWPPPDDKHY